MQFNLIATLGVRCFYRNNFILCRAQKLEHVQDKLVLVSSIKKHSWFAFWEVYLDSLATDSTSTSYMV